MSSDEIKEEKKLVANDYENKEKATFTKPSRARLEDWKMPYSRVWQSNMLHSSLKH